MSCVDFQLWPLWLPPRGHVPFCLSRAKALARTESEEGCPGLAVGVTIYGHKYHDDFIIFVDTVS